MSHRLAINGVVYTDQFKRESLVINETVQARGQTMKVVVQINENDIAVPLAGQEIVFVAGTFREFAGRIANVLVVQDLGPNEFAYELTCFDYTIDLDGHLIQRDFEGGDAQDIIRSIVGQVGKKFTSNNVTGSVAIAGFRADLDPPSAIISRIAETIQHSWYVDYNRDVNFFYILDRPAPIPEIDADNATLSYGDLQIRESWDQVKNRIFLAGGKSKSTNQDNIVVTGDGDLKFIPTNYEPWDIASTTVTVDTVPQTILLDGIDGEAGDGQGSAGEVYLCLDNWGVRFPDAHAPAANADIEIDYNYGLEPIVVIEDPVSIATMKDIEDTATAPSDGVHEIKFQIPEIRVEDEQTIWEYGQLLLQRYSKIVFMAQFTSWIQRWQIGQNLRIFSALRGFDQTMFIVAISKTILTVEAADENFMAFTITASSSPFPP